MCVRFVPQGGAKVSEHELEGEEADDGGEHVALERDGGHLREEEGSDERDTETALSLSLSLSLSVCLPFPISLCVGLSLSLSLSLALCPSRSLASLRLHSTEVRIEENTHREYGICQAVREGYHASEQRALPPALPHREQDHAYLVLPERVPSKSET